MKDTIFSPAFGNRPTDLVGRDAMIKELDELLDSRPGTKDRAILLIGQRGTGKTALLWEIADIARKKGYITASPTVAADGMLSRIVEKIEDEAEDVIKSEKIYVKGANIGVLGFSAGIEVEKDKTAPKSEQYKILHIARALSKMNRGLLLLIDELQANSQEIRNLVILYQEMVGEGLNIALYMAGLPMAVSSVLNDRVLTFLNRSKKIPLEPLKCYDIESFFSSSFKKLSVRIDDSMCKKAAQAAEGSPYMMQLIGHLLTIYSGDSGLVSKQIFDKSISQAKEEFKNDVCITTIANLSDKDTEFLISLAKGDEICSVSDVARGMGVTNDYAGKYRKRLLSTGIIDSPSRGRLRIVVPYLREYLREM